mmetsp:Transcript_72311/g.130125  ORF Transcript_72311/g.130125 Transcript_72311/m.130125 type:complete len:97 (-) Transcript_72311:741-1031(-)
MDTSSPGISSGGQLLTRRSPVETRVEVRSSGPLGTVSCGFHLDWESSRQLADDRSTRVKAGDSETSEVARLGTRGVRGVGGHDKLNSCGAVSFEVL